MLLIDTFNLYHCSWSYYNRNLLYEELIKKILAENEWFQGEGIAFVRNTGTSMGFVSWLKSTFGLKVVSKTLRNAKADSFDVEMTIAALQAATRGEQLIICSSSINLLPLIKTLHTNGTSPTVYGVCPPKAFEAFADVRPIPKGLCAALPTTE